MPSWRQFDAELANALKVGAKENDYSAASRKASSKPRSATFCLILVAKAPVSLPVLMLDVSSRLEQTLVVGHNKRPIRSDAKKQNLFLFSTS